MYKQGIHLQLYKSNIYLWKYYTEISDIFVSRLP